MPLDLAVIVNFEYNYLKNVFNFHVWWDSSEMYLENWFKTNYAIVGDYSKYTLGTHPNSQT